MAIIRLKTNEIQCKVVYYGTGLSGKTTNLVMIHEAIGNRGRGDLISINTAGDRTIFFDFLPMDLGSVRGLNIKISVYTVPGQVMYNETRKTVLKGADGVVFVADSLQVRKNENVESLRNLEDNLRDDGQDLASMPLVLQYNKRDLNAGVPSIMSIEELQADLNPHRKWPSHAASALRGHGVRETFKEICMMTVAEVCRKMFEEQRGRAHGLNNGKSR
jgi:GTPase SAR1 family protein